MAVVAALRGDNAYFGLGKQSLGGTAVAPTVFPRWLDGSSIEIDAKMEDIWEGDSSRRLSQIIKNRQMVKIKLVCNPRPVEVGFLVCAALGAGADTPTAPATNTTLAASVAAGATTFTVASNAGLTSAGTAVLDIEPGLSTEEVVTVTTPVTGAGPYTATIASGGVTKFAHANAGTVISPVVHTETDQADGNFYSVEVSIGGTSGIIIRARDCKVETFKCSAETGRLLTVELEMIGLAVLVQGSASTVTLEARQAFLFTQGVWTLDGATTGDAPNVSKFDLTVKNNLDKDIQTEALILAGLIFGNINVDVTLEVVFTSASHIALTYLGSTTGTTDSQTLGVGSLSLLFTQADTFHTLKASITTLVYTKAGVPQPKRDGKAFRMPLQGSSTSNMGANTNVVQYVTQNVQVAAY